MLPLDDARPHASPFVESEDSGCRSLAFLHVLFIVDAKNYRGSEPRIWVCNHEGVVVDIKERFAANSIAWTFRLRAAVKDTQAEEEAIENAQL